MWLLSMTMPGTSSPLYYSHPKLIVFGFVYGFIFSVVLVLVPRFRNIYPSHRKALKVSMLMTYQVGVLLHSLWPPHSAPWLLGYVLSLASSSLFAYYVVRMVGRPSGPLAAADPIISLSSSTAPVTILFSLIAEFGGHNTFLRNGVLLLTLYGVAGSMIFGIGIKTTHFRIELKVRRRLWELIAPLLFLSASAASLSFLFDNLTLELVALISYVTTSLLWIYSVDGLKRVKRGERYNKMNERDRVRYLFFSAIFVVACIWLIFGGLTGLLSVVFLELQNSFTFGLRDAFIHSVGIGFIGNIIVAYSPLLLPGLLSAKTPYRGLSLYPLILLNSGNLLRVAWFVSGAPKLDGLVLLSVALYLSSVVLIIIMMIRQISYPC